MAVVNSILLSQLEFGNRIDGELYNPFLTKSYGTLIQSKLTIKQIKELCLIRSGTTPADRDDELKEGPVLFKTTDIRNNVICPEDKFYHITSEIHKRMRSTKLQHYDVLLNIVGATLDVIGRTGFIADLFQEANITQAMVFIRCKTQELKPGFIFAYLNSRYAQDQIKRYARPTGQYNLNLQEVGQIRIPLIQKEAQAQIHKHVVDAAYKLKESYSLYTQAVHMLEVELGLDKLRFDKPLSYEARLSEVVGKIRGDAEYHNPVLREYYKYLTKKFNLVKITEYADVIKFGNPDYAVSGTPIITQKHLGDITPSGYGDEPIANNAWVEKYPSAILRKDDLLLYSVGAYLGKTNIWLNDDKAVPASFITMLRCSQKQDSGYLMALLNSKYGILQSKVFQSGTSQQYIYPKDIKQFLVPDIDLVVRTNLYRLIIESQKAKIESQQLLAEAKRRVEELIEEVVEK